MLPLFFEASGAGIIFFAATYEAEEEDVQKQKVIALGVVQRQFFGTALRERFI